MGYYDTSSESSSRSDDDSTSSTGSSSDAEQEPTYIWNNNKYVNEHGSVILWTDGSCKGNHLGPDGGATSGIGVWVHKRKFWKKKNHKYPDTNQVSFPPFLSYRQYY